MAPDQRNRRGGAIVVALGLGAGLLSAVTATPAPAATANTPTYPVVQANVVTGTPDNWWIANRSAAPAMRKAAGPLRAVTTAQGDSAVFGVSNQSKVLELTSDGKGGRDWNTYALSTLTGTGQVNPGIAPLVEASGALDAFCVTTAGHLLQLRQDGGTWTATDLTAATGSPAVTGSPTALRSGGRIVVLTRTASGKVFETIDDSLHGGLWSTYNLTALASGQRVANDLTAVDSPAGDSLLHVFGSDAAGHLIEYVNNNVGGRYWNTYDVTSASGSGVTIKGDPTTLEWGGRARVIALSPGGHYVMYTATTTSGSTVWTVKDLSVKSPGVPTFRSSPTAAVAGTGIAIAGTTTTKHLVTIMMAAPQVGPSAHNASQAVPGIPTFLGRPALIVRGSKISAFASGLTLPVAGSVGVYAYPSPTRAISDGWPIVGVTGAIGTCASPWTGLGWTPHNSNDEQTGFAIQNSGRSIPWLSFWTVSGPSKFKDGRCTYKKDQSPAAFYEAGRLGGVWVAHAIGSYAADGLGIKPTSVILDTEGYPDFHSGLDTDIGAPTDTGRARFAEMIRGWTDGLHSVDASLPVGLYVNQAEYLAYNLRSNPLPTFVAVAWGGSTPPRRLPGVDGANIKGFTAFFVGTPFSVQCDKVKDHVSLLASWGAPWNTIQFDPGTSCHS